MKLSYVRRRSVALASLTLTTALLACGEDKRVKQLSAGITRDSAVSVMAQDAKGGHDEFPNVYSREQYLVEGKNYEVLYFSPDGKKFAPGDSSVHLRDLTPIVFVNNVLAGKGWPVWDSIAGAHKIPVVPKPAK